MQFVIDSNRPKDKQDFDFRKSVHSSAKCKDARSSAPAGSKHNKSVALGYDSWAASGYNYTCWA